MPLHIACRDLLCSFAIFCAIGLSTASHVSAAVTILPTPHDEHHLVPLGPSDFRDTQGAPAKTVADRSGTFDQTALVLQGPYQAKVNIRHAGKYALWLRISKFNERQEPMRVQLSNGDKSVIAGTINGSTIDASLGGPKALADYLAAAKKNTPAGLVPSLDTTKLPVAGEKKKTKPAADDLLGDILGEKNDRPKDPWVNLKRVEEYLEGVPYYWWKLPLVELQPGMYTLRIEPENKFPVTATNLPRLDAALLTTNDKLIYPYAPDIGRSRGTFVRFRLDQLPKDGVKIQGAFQTHVLQHPRLTCVFGAEGLDRDAHHTAQGLSCWYRLQDVEFLPQAPAHEFGMQISVVAGKGTSPLSSGFAGATQFATFPHNDFVIREFPWNEPTGLAYTVPVDVETYAHRLMTFRDHAREHYETAASYTPQLNPLTRGDLLITGICGAWNAHDRDYMVKTMRLMGFNSISEVGDPLPGRKHYGWHGAQFAATLPLGYPIDEEKSRAEYEDYFRKYFADPKVVEVWKDVKSYCMSDEPSEAFRPDMTAPVWQYIEEKGERYWLDAVGASELYTKLPEVSDCVCEATIERTGRMLQLRVGVDDPQNPRHYWYWTLGYPLGPALNANLISGEYVADQLGRPNYRMVKSMSNPLGKLRIKIVQQNGTATLFVNGNPIHQHMNLPKHVRFGIAGNNKKIYDLRLRPLKPGEGVALLDGDLQASTPKKNDEPALEEFGLNDLPQWARPKPVQQAFADNWVTAGGNHEIKQAFRRWAQEHGATPELFGAKSWDEVHPLTFPNLVRNETEARLFYWSRQFSGWFTPHRFAMISDAVAKFAPNPDIPRYAALSGGVLYRAKEMPMDMFAQAGHGHGHTGGISDWMFYSTWRWDSHQAVAYSAELFNAGARRHGERPLSYPMMHCVSPTTFRAYTQVANQVRILSCYAYGPYYLNMPDAWSQSAGCYEAVSHLANRAALCDDILASGVRRPSRVALLYALSTEYWNPKSSFDDKRSTFLALSHEYYQPEVVTEQQVLDGALQHYDALYVLDPNVRADVQTKIGEWTNNGGLLWACADALSRDEFNRPSDLLSTTAKITRAFDDSNTPSERTVRAEAGKSTFRSHTVSLPGMPRSVDAGSATVLARYNDGSPAWLQTSAGKGRVVYVAHRAGTTYAMKNIQAPGYREIWASTGRELLTQPLHETQIARSLVLSEPTIMATATDNDGGSVVMLYNMWPNARRNLEVRLLEPAKPHSVETFDGLSLKNLPFEYDDGWVSTKLDTFDEGQMIVVRRTPAPTDDRLDKMRERTVAQLASTDPDALSAGIWFAGYYPSWQLADKIVPLLDHTDWRIRRASAEALGRLRHKPAAEKLHASLAKETDPHVLADKLEALAQIGHGELARVIVRYVAHPHFLVRLTAFQTLRQLDAPAQASLTKLVLRGTQDIDQRVRRGAIGLAGRLAPEFVVQNYFESFSRDDSLGALDRPLWAETVVHHEAALTALMFNHDKLSPPLIAAAGRHRADERLLPPLVSSATSTASRTWPKEQVADWVAAVLKQRSIPLARQLFEQRDKLPANLQAYVPLFLEHATEAGRGQVIADWEAYFAELNKSSASNR